MNHNLVCQSGSMYKEFHKSNMWAYPSQLLHSFSDQMKMIQWLYLWAYPSHCALRSCLLRLHMSFWTRRKAGRTPPEKIFKKNEDNQGRRSRESRDSVKEGESIELSGIVEWREGVRQKEKGCTWECLLPPVSLLHLWRTNLDKGNRKNKPKLMSFQGLFSSTP